MREMLHFSDKDISHGVLRADVQGGRRRQGPRQVPDQRAGRGQAQVADRRVPRVLRGRGRAAHRRRDARHRRAPSSTWRARGVEFLRTPDAYYEEAPARVGEIDEDMDDLRRLGILVDRDDEGYLLQIFTKPIGDRPTRVLRGHRAPRRARLRRRQLQGAVRGDRARAGAAGQPVSSIRQGRTGTVRLARRRAPRSTSAAGALGEARRPARRAGLRLLTTERGAGGGAGGGRGRGGTVVARRAGPGGRDRRRAARRRRRRPARRARRRAVIDTPRRSRPRAGASSRTWWRWRCRRRCRGRR